MKKAAKKSKVPPKSKVSRRSVNEQKSTETSEAFRKFHPGKPRNTNNSNVGPSWGGRKGN